ncbi:ribonuclease R [Christensenellaceae bacterium OttesenSCG-928-K19]|nr:ribonuclease R [Christensenellaceae bacterium OttesenSCG-928-K19]
MDIRQRILDVTEKQIYTTKEQLAKALGVSAKKLEEPLRQLLANHELATSKNGSIALAGTMGYFKGKLEGKKSGYAFLRTTDDMQDIFIGEKERNGALDGEEVLVRLKKRQKGGSNPEGKVVEILEQGPAYVVGTVVKNRKTAYVMPDDSKMPEIYIAYDAKPKVKDEQKVVVELVRRAERGRPAQGKVTEILGMTGDTGVDILSYARRFGLVAGFNKKCRKEARALLEQPVSMEDRLDLRHELIFTIDGADAKDLDDAVSLKKLVNGNWLLGVHIADVSYYVKEGGELDREALSRGTSVYLLDRVIPMLPEELSNDLCSLNPDEDKYTLSCMMEIDKGGVCVAHEMANTVIRTKYRMTYDGVNEVLQGKTVYEYGDAADTLRQMNELAGVLRKKRFEKGSIDFDLSEPLITLDEKGVPQEVGVRSRGDAEKLIEEFMLMANVTVAKHFYDMDVPFLYRVHEQPDADKIRELSIFLGNFGIRVPGNGDVRPKDIQDVLTKVENLPEQNVVNSVVLRSLKKAHYDIRPVEHFGLAADRYCHFTSPIRRYPDLMVHRIAKLAIAKGLKKKACAHLDEILPGIAKQSSERERNAIEAERAVNDLKMAEYMGRHIGEEYEGVVSGVTRFGIFVELENTIEGMIPLAQLEDDYYNYHEKQYCVIGERTGKKITLGDKARIQVVSADIALGKIEFTFAE